MVGGMVPATVASVVWSSCKLQNRLKKNQDPELLANQN